MNIKKTLYKISHWETWHYLAKYIPLLPAWLWYCVRARSLWFFTPSNPTITFGGMEGERKSEMYKQLPAGSYPHTIYITAGMSFEDAEKMALQHKFTYPFAVKPDIGMMGFMFRRIENGQQLKKYHAAIKADYLIQQLVNYPLEVSVFYYRFPNRQQGAITGFLKKEFLQVTGDGTSTLLELIQDYQRVSFRLEEMKAKHESRLSMILPAGQIFILSPALNLSRGGKLVSLAHEKDGQLLQVFDELSHYTKEFYYGRYDIKCASIEDLKQGNHFSILEFNGCGAEPHHIYGNGYNLLQAYRIVLHHWKILFKISVYNHSQGIPFWTYKDGLQYLRAAKKHFKILRKTDAGFEL